MLPHMRTPRALLRALTESIEVGAEEVPIGINPDSGAVVRLGICGALATQLFFVKFSLNLLF